MNFSKKAFARFTYTENMWDTIYGAFKCRKRYREQFLPANNKVREKGRGRRREKEATAVTMFAVTAVRKRTRNDHYLLHLSLRVHPPRALYRRRYIVAEHALRVRRRTRPRRMRPAGISKWENLSRSGNGSRPGRASRRCVGQCVSRGEVRGDEVASG